MKRLFYMQTYRIIFYRSKRQKIRKKSLRSYFSRICKRFKYWIYKPKIILDLEVLIFLHNKVTFLQCNFIFLWCSFILVQCEVIFLLCNFILECCNFIFLWCWIILERCDFIFFRCWVQFLCCNFIFERCKFIFIKIRLDDLGVNPLQW